MYIEPNEATAKKRRFTFFLVDATDGKTPETGEAGGQPEISIDFAAWTSTGVGVLVGIGGATNYGRYYAELTQAVVEVDHAIIMARYKSAETVETPADQMIEVGGHRVALAALSHDVLWDHADKTIEVFSGAGYQGGNGDVLFTHTVTDAGADKTLLSRS
jgi:hypothetical protein